MEIPWYHFVLLSRSLLLNHMVKEHGFNVGLPDNIVHCDEFLDTLQAKLDRYVQRRQCWNRTFVRGPRSWGPPSDHRQSLH